MRNEVNKTIQFEKMQCWYYWWEGFMKDAFEMHIPSFLKFGTGVQAMLRFCLSNLRGCNVGISDGKFIKYAFEMGSGSMIYIPSFIKIDLGIQKLLGWERQRNKHTHRAG
jgi:hypothetical protein